MPAFNFLAGKQLTITSLVDMQFMAVAFLIMLIVALLAGSYPALPHII
jgi:ABC-type lipoprotein release transport system permease subunit